MNSKARRVSLELMDEGALPDEALPDESLQLMEALLGEDDVLDNLLRGVEGASPGCNV
jgi:hypothetical protein